MSEPGAAVTRPHLVLASASPRRLTLLRQIGLEPTVRAADLDETLTPGTHPAINARLLAQAKAALVAERCDGPSVVIGADTIVSVDDIALGKPTSPADAAGMLRRLSGRTHQVHTGVAVITTGPDAGSNTMVSATVTTQVTMRPITDSEISAYVATSEATDAAGAYAIQGRAAVFIDRINGDYTNVVGLPVGIVSRLLEQVGFTVTEQWDQPTGGSPG